MGVDMAIYCLRREPQSEQQARACRAALETIGRSTIPIRDAEVDIMRPFSLDELAVLRSIRSNPHPAA